MSYRKRIFFADSPSDVTPFPRDPSGAEATGVGAESWVGGRRNSTGYQINDADPQAGGFGSIGKDIEAAQRGTLGMHLVENDPTYAGGKTLVTTLPPGTYGMLTRVGGEVELWRFDYAQDTDLGDVGTGSSRSTRTAAGVDLSRGARAGAAAAANARTTGDRLRRINERNAAFWAPGGRAGLK
jgi:hypothetical protein